MDMMETTDTTDMTGVLTTAEACGMADSPAPLTPIPLIAPTTRANPVPPTTVPHLWRNRDFVILATGQAISLIGRGTALWALPYLALALYHQPWLFGTTTAVGWLPPLLFAIPAGIVADRVNRRTLMVVCDTCRALLLASIALALLLHCLTLPQLLLVAFGEAVLSEVFNVAQAASLPQIAGTDEATFRAASGIMGNITNLGQLLGPAFGGLLVPLAWPLPFTETALTFLYSAFSLMRLRARLNGSRPTNTPAATPVAGLSTRRGHSRMEFASGVTWLWQNRTLRMVAVLSGLANVVMITLPNLLTLYCYSLGFSASQTGFVVAALGVGALAGSAVTPTVTRWWGFGFVYIVFSLLQAALWPVLLVCHTLLAIAAIGALAGAIDQIVSVAQYTYRGLSIPNHLSARVQGVFRTVIYAGGTAGSLLLGASDQRFGLQTVVWGGTALLSAGGVWSWLSACIRHAPAPAAPTETAAHTQTTDGLKEEDTPNRTAQCVTTPANWGLESQHDRGGEIRSASLR